jgi:AraC-like DNA-binding protein
MSTSATPEDHVAATSTVGSIQTSDLLDALQSLGADRAALCRRAGLRPGDLADPDARIPSSRVLQLFHEAARRLRDPHVGLHAGARVQTRGALFYLILSSAHLGEGLRRCARYARVALDTQDVLVGLGGDTVSLTVDPGDPTLAASRHLCDYIMGAVLGTLRRAVPHFRPNELDLVHDRFGAPGEAERLFGCPVRFGRRRNALRFPAAALRSVPAAANTVVAQQLEKYAASVLSRLDSGGLEDRVDSLVRRMLVEGLRPDRSQVAHRLHMSARTLHRRLRDAGTSFNEVRDRVRVETARALLADTSLKVEAVGQSVGYSQAAAFSKAFRRWVGDSPARYRERCAGKTRAALAPAHDPGARPRGRPGFAGHGGSRRRRNRPSRRLRHRPARAGSASSS